MCERRARGESGDEGTHDFHLRGSLFCCLFIAVLGLLDSEDVNEDGQGMTEWFPYVALVNIHLHRLGHT